MRHKGRPRLIEDDAAAKPRGAVAMHDTVQEVRPVLWAGARAVSLAAIAVACLCGPAYAQDGPARSLAVVETSAELAPLSLLVQAWLSERGLVLVERGDLHRILQEQALSAGGLAEPDALVEVGALLRADGLLLLSLEEGGPAAGPPTIPGMPPPAEAPPQPAKPEGLLRLRLIETAHGVRLLDWFVAWDPEKAEEAAAEVVAKVSEVAPKLKLPAGQVIPIGVVDVHRVQLADEHQWMCQAFRTILSARLAKEPRIIVLEREDLRRLLDEKLLTAGEQGEFWRSGVLIEGYMQRAGKEVIELKLQCKRPGGEELPLAPLAVEVEKLQEAAEKSAQAIVQQVTNAPPAAAWNPAKEAEEFYRQGELLGNHNRGRAALPLVETANALAPENLHHGVLLLRLSLQWDQTGPYATDGERADLVARLLPLLRRRSEGIREWDLDTWDLAYGFIWYFNTPSSVASPAIVEMNRGNRRAAVELYGRVASLSGSWVPESWLLIGALTESSTIPEGIVNTRAATRKAVLPAEKGGENKSDEARLRACLAMLDSLTVLSGTAPYHLTDVDNSLAKGLLGCFEELARDADPVARFFGCAAVSRFCGGPSPFLVLNADEDQWKAWEQSWRGLAGSLDRAGYSDKALATFKQICDGLPELSDAVKRHAAAELLRCATGSLEKRVAAYEQAFAPLIEREDVEGLVLLCSGMALLFPSPDGGRRATETAGRYVRLLTRVAGVLDDAGDDKEVLYCVQWVRHAANIVRDGFRMRFQELKRDPALFDQPSKPDGREPARQELTAILEAFPEFSKRRERAALTVRMLLRARDWPQPWNFFEEGWLYSRIVPQDGSLWVALTDHGEQQRNARVGLAGLDMRDGSVVGLWQARCGSLSGRQPLSGVVLGDQKSYVAIENVGLVQFPGRLTGGRAFMEPPRVLSQKNGLPPGHIVGIAPLGNKLWVAYAEEGSGFGIYDPEVHTWETLFASDVTGDTPFQDGSTYELRELTAMPGGIAFLAFASRHSGLWGMDATTHSLRYLFPCSNYAAILSADNGHWVSTPDLLARLNPAGAKLELLLAGRDGLGQLMDGEGARWAQAAWALDRRPFVPEREQAATPFGLYLFGDIDLSTAAVHGDELWARYGKSQIIVLHRGKGFEDATIMDNDILEGGKVLQFFETPHGLIAIGEGSVGLIHTGP